MALECDLQLPACNNCRTTDVECTFWDTSLRREISCSRLHFLRKRKQQLELEIQNLNAQAAGELGESNLDLRSASTIDQGYFLDVLHDDVPQHSEPAYLGPGNSGRLLQRLLKSAIQWHFENGISIPKRLLPDGSSRLMEFNHSYPQPSFLITNDQRKLELQSLVPPSTQRAIVQHYLKVVSVEYTLLPSDRESALLAHENPLRWIGANKETPDALALNVVFAISSTLIARDLDSNLSTISARCLNELHKIAYVIGSDNLRMERMRWTSTALCALALCEIINPTSGQLWDLLGGACSTIEDLRQEYQFQNIELDDAFTRLEHCLIKLESSTSLYFRRHSSFCAIRLKPRLEESSPLQTLPDDLATLGCLQQISEHMTRFPRQPEDFFENLIPLRFQITSISANISIQSARLYVALHPLFTPSDTSPTGTFNVLHSRLFQIVAHSASAIIDHFAYLNENDRIISVCMAVEQVIEAGLVWGTYLISHKGTTETPNQNVYKLGTSLAMSPIFKVSTIIASFVARWKNGSAYAQAWESFVELLLNMI